MSFKEECRMKSQVSDAKLSGLSSSRDTILKLYEGADESTRMDMYMTYRDMRASFEMVEASTAARPLEADPGC
jgi:hypothetical protein